MSEIIKKEIEIMQDEVQQRTGKKISDDRAFSYALLKNIFNVDSVDQDDLITDGSNDGGIDFLYFDEEESKVIMCQSKYTTDLGYDQIITELNKMYSTFVNFKKAHTGSYNDKLKSALQNAIDRLPDDNLDNIEFDIFTTADIDDNLATKKIENSIHDFSTDAVRIFSIDEIEKQFQEAQESLSTVKSWSLKLDKANNYLEYESNDLEGIMCNVLSSSIVQIYNKFAGKGLFDLNIRKYIRHKLVDEGVKKTLDKDRDNFWFLNNGIIIACTDFDVDGDTVKLSDFSIVNGGQTTTLIGNYKGTNSNEFSIPCKIVATKNDDDASTFYTKIAGATNSQKPIFPRDLKSNSPEMVKLSKMLEKEDVYLEIKRGYKPGKTYKYNIKNDELGQYILSFALQQPGTSRSGKRKIFDTDHTYDRIFKVNYDKDPNKKGFLLDLIDLQDRYKEVESKYKKSGLDPIQTEILKNGKQTIFALMGVCYRLANDDISVNDLLNSPASLGTIPPEYGAFISNYHGDDLSKKIDSVIKDLVIILADGYKHALNNKTSSSVSNYMKTDAKYYNEIVNNFATSLNYNVGQDLILNYDFFKR